MVVPRPIARLLIFCGLMLLGLSGPIALARRADAPPDWMLYTTVNGRQKTLYRALTDGTHNEIVGEFLPSSNVYTYATLRPGLLMIESEGVYRERVVEWRHINGKRLHPVITGPGHMAISHYSTTGDWVALPLEYGAQPEYWQIYFSPRAQMSSHRTRIHPPTPTAELWRFMDDDRLVWWLPANPASLTINTAEPGDLVVANKNGEILYRLTSTKRVYYQRPYLWQTDWLYFYQASDAGRDLYRIAQDGSAPPQLVTSDIFSTFIIMSSGQTPLDDWIYWRGGDLAEPQAFRARPDGTERTALANFPSNSTLTFQAGPDANWVYYVTIAGSSGTSGGDLWRFHLITHTRDLVATNVAYTPPLVWSPDKQWLIYPEVGAGGNLVTFTRVRPDGSDDEEIAERAADRIFQLEEGRALLYLSVRDGSYAFYRLDLQTFTERRLPLEISSYPTLLSIVHFPAQKWGMGWLPLLLGGLLIGGGRLLTKRVK